MCDVPVGMRCIHSSSNPSNH